MVCTHTFDFKVTGSVLKKVVEWCEQYKDNDVVDERWDREFMGTETNMFYEIMLAANYMNIKPLLDLTARTLADVFNGTERGNLLQICNIQDDLNEEEKADIQRDNAWIGDKPIDLSSEP